MEASDLAAWIRQFADRYYYVSVPPLEQVQQAIAAYLPEKESECATSTTAQELLEQALGIVVIVKLGDEQVAWSVTANRAQAEAMQQTYSGDAYSAVRKALGVDAQWILLVNPDVMFTHRDLYEAHMDLMEEEQPECVVVQP